MKKILIRITLALLIIVLLAGAYFAYNGFKTAQNAQTSMVNIETATLSQGALVITISATGKVRSGQSAILSWQTSGTVEAVNVAVHEEVQRGDVLANLEKASLPQEIILAQANLLDYQQALDDLYTKADEAKTQAVQDIATYTQAVKDAQFQLDNYTIPSEQAGLETMQALALMKTRLDQARQEFEPYKYLSANNNKRKELLEALNVAQADYNAAVKRLQYETELEVAQANQEKAMQDYEKWKDGPTVEEVNAAEARIAATQATLSEAWVEAPFDGTITIANPQPGDQVSANTQAFRMDDLSKLYVDMQIAEVDINQIEVGQEVSLTFDGIRNTQYHGKVVEVASIGSESSGVVDFTVTVLLTDADENVRPGMTSDVEIVVQQRQPALLVPNQALRMDENGNQTVYVIKPGEGPKPVIVQLGASSDTYSEIAEGDLVAGDAVILNPLSVPGVANGQQRNMFFGIRRMNGGGNPDNHPTGAGPAGGAGNGEGQP
jgi:HlyD family secretion protein